MSSLLDPPSLLDPKGRDATLQRVAALRPGEPALWGKMDAPQMLVHCQQGLRLAAGELRLKRALIGRLIGGLARNRFIRGEAPFMRNSPTDPSFRITGEHDFETERAKLVELVRDFGAHGPRAVGPHPFFGALTREDWDRLMAKHLDHHLRQFGV